MSDYFLADDLSGALDAAAGFHGAGRPVTIALSPEAWPRGLPADGVVGVTTETRNMTPERARETIGHVLALGRERRARLLYKKIDSTLRGPVAAELAAVAAAMPDFRFLFAPANPRVGRVVRDGVLWVQGVPLAQTDFARDPASPINESSVRRLLGAAATERIVIPDTGTESDLAAAVAQMDGDGRPWIAVGSGALARVVGARHRGTLAAATLSAPSVTKGAILFVGGSAHPANRAQAQRLADAAGVPLHEVGVSDPQAAGAKARDSLRRAGAAALLVEARRTASTAALAAICAAARAAMEEGTVTRIFVTGGETAHALCGALGIATLEFVGEIEAGMSLSKGRGTGRTVAFAIKPGGFGDAQTWLRAWEALRAAG